MSPWGKGYKDKNRFQEYYTQIVRSVESEDWMYFKQLREELTQEQYLDIWYKLASYTRSSIKEKDNE